MEPFWLLSIYNLITLTIAFLLLVFCKRKINSDRVRDIVLKTTAVLVVVIHFSSLYVEYFSNEGQALIGSTMLLPVYPCNIVMWLLVIVAFMKNKDTKLYKYLSEFTFIGGTICGLIGVIFNFNFLDNPNFLDYDIFKGLVSHTIMIFGTIYLYVFKYVKIEAKRTFISIIVGLLIFSVIGLIINVLFKIFNISSVNAMFMLEPPFEDLPFINFFTIGILAVLVSFVGLNIYEYFTLPKENRWLYNFKNKERK